MAAEIERLQNRCRELELQLKNLAASNPIRDLRVFVGTWNMGTCIHHKIVWILALNLCSDQCLATIF